MLISEGNDKVEFFVFSVNTYLYAYFKKIGAQNFTPRVTAEYKEKYIHLTAYARGDKWSWGFIDRTNGDCLAVLKEGHPSTLTPRGNIFDGYDGLSQVDWNGFKEVTPGTGMKKGFRGRKR